MIDVWVILCDLTTKPLNISLAISAPFGGAEVHSWHASLSDAARREIDATLVATKNSPDAQRSWPTLASRRPEMVRAGSTRIFGYTMCVLGAVAVGPDAVLLRTQHLAGGSTPVISVWRYILLCICNLMAALIFEGTPRKLIAGARNSKWQLIFCSCLIVVINMGFTISLLYVEAAKALLFISLNPLWAALLGKVLLGDALETRTVVAQAFSLVASFLVFVPALSTLLPMPSSATLVLASAMADEGDELGSGELFNMVDLVPLFTGMAVAGQLTFSRWQSHASLELAPCGGALLTAVFALIIHLGVDQEPIETLVVGLQPHFWAALLGSAIGSAVYDSALVIAPRSLSSAEVALILLGETVKAAIPCIRQYAQWEAHAYARPHARAAAHPPTLVRLPVCAPAQIFGPFWVWVVYDEMPDTWTVAGGGLLLCTLIGHEVAAMLKCGGKYPAAVNEPSRVSGSVVSLASSSEADDLGAQLFNIGGHRSPVIARAVWDMEHARSNTRSSSYDSSDRMLPLLEDDRYMHGSSPPQASLPSLLRMDPTGRARTPSL